MRKGMAVAICLGPVLSGCRPAAPVRAGSIMPPSGSVRIIPKKVSEGPKKVQWMWTVLGDRNWSATSVVDDSATLSGSFPLNSLTRTGGTNVWELWITATTAEANVASTVNIEIKLRGSNGAGVTNTKSIDKWKLKDALLPLVVNTETVRLPAEIRVAEVGGKTQKLVIKD